MEYLTIILRTVFFYIFLIVIFRLMGKREIGELSILDLIIYFLMSEVASIAIEDHSISIWRGITPILVLGVIQILFAYISLNSRRFRNILEGYPSIVIENGKIKDQVMKKLRYNIDDLLLQLSEKDILDVSEVCYAILEPSGKLSIIKKQSPDEKGKQTPAYPLIIDGEVVEFSLRKLKKDQEWLSKEIKKRGYIRPDQIFYCSYNQGKFYIDEYDSIEISDQ